MATIKIPDDRGNVVKVTINGRTWTFEAGTTLEVPDEIEDLLIHKGLIEPPEPEPTVPPEAIYINVTEDDGTYSADVTYDDVADAVGVTPIWIKMPDGMGTDDVLATVQMKTASAIHLAGSVVESNGVVKTVDVWLDPTQANDGVDIAEYELTPVEDDGGK